MIRVTAQQNAAGMLQTKHATLIATIEAGRYSVDTDYYVCDGVVWSVFPGGIYRTESGEEAARIRTTLTRMCKAGSAIDRRPA